MMPTEQEIKEAAEKYQKQTHLIGGEPDFTIETFVEGANWVINFIKSKENE